MKNPNEKGGNPTAEKVNGATGVDVCKHLWGGKCGLHCKATSDRQIALTFEHSKGQYLGDCQWWKECEKYEPVRRGD